MACIKPLLFSILLIIELSIINSVFSDSKKASSSTHLEADLKHEWKEFEEFREWKKWKNNYKKDSTENYNKSKKQRNHWIEKKESSVSNDSILMARYIVNQANWTSVATISTRSDIKSYPFANVVSVSDGHLGNGSGIPYVFLTPLDETAQDLAKDRRTTMMMTLAQGPWCKDKAMDPMDPRCARITLSGQIKQISTSDRDYETAKSAVFGRHPWLSHMPPDHQFFFAKLKIGSIALLDAFGGPKYIDVKQYLAATIDGFSIELFKKKAQWNQLDSLESLENSQIVYQI